MSGEDVALVVALWMIAIALAGLLMLAVVR